MSAAGSGGACRGPGARRQFPPFGQDPWWLVVLQGRSRSSSCSCVLVLFTIWAERRVVARMQMRIGPNRVGPFGLLQGLMDGIKLALKEEIIPTAADKAVYFLAPVISARPGVHGHRGDPVRARGVDLRRRAPRCSSPTSRSRCSTCWRSPRSASTASCFAGWSSGSTYPLLGALRSSAQMISYEIAMGLSFVAVFLYAGSMSTSQIVTAQQPIWYAVILLPSLRHLRHRDGGRDQPRARSTCPRRRASWSPASTPSTRR